MDEFYCNGKMYYYDNGKWLDENCENVPSETVCELNKLILNPMTIDEKDMEYLLRVVYGARRGENYQLAVVALEESIRRAVDENQIAMIRSLLPRLSASYRRIRMSNKAIDECKKMLDIYGKKIWSSYLFISLAGAYCDIDEYEIARKFANIAKWLIGAETSYALTNVYQRINNAVA